MVTQRVDILIAIKLRLNCSPVFLIEVPLQKALPSAPRLQTQIKVSEGETWCHLKNASQGPERWEAPHVFKPSESCKSQSFPPRIGVSREPEQTRALDGEKQRKLLRHLAGRIQNSSSKTSSI